MIFTQKNKIGVRIFLALLAIFSTILAISLGLALSTNIKRINIENFIVEKPALPSIILDRNGEVISELVGVEQRTLLEFNDLPKSLVFTLLTREDKPFFEHNGFSVSGFSRAVFKILTTQSLSNGGGSTLTQQLAKIRLDNMQRRNIFTKLEELWEAWQIERQYSKQEIMQMYLNKVNFGHGAYGIEASSKFFFKHSARENTPAESVMSIIQVVRPGSLYSPLRRPQAAKKVQRRILSQMVNNGYITKEEADSSFASFWLNFDWSRDSTETVHNVRNENDKAKWFTEYVREELKKLLYGKQDVYKDGYIIHTTLDLNFQRAADKHVLDRLAIVRKDFNSRSSAKSRAVYEQFSDVISLMGLVVNIPDIKVEDKVKDRKESEYFTETVAPDLRVLSLMTGLGSLNNISQLALKGSENESNNKIETGLITLDNSTGQILALVGGSKFETTNQFNNALDAAVSPGSSFKPLYISAGISSNQLSPGTHFIDKPTTFKLDGHDDYTPNNYNGIWRGDVLLRNAVKRSLNIPSITSLQKVGFDAAIDRSAKLLGITDPGEIRRTFERVFPMALGTMSVSPSQMARAYATFANKGRSSEPFGIRFIEDQKGKIIVHVEDEMRQKSFLPQNDVMSPQDAYIMTNIMESTITSGTLNYGYRNLEDGFDGMSMAGKTGTSQNWEDSWAIGYSPYYTTSLWYGFDGGSESLGQSNNGAVLAGLVWSRYMKDIHLDLPKKDFHRPKGIIERTICLTSGGLKTQKCPASIREVFKAGTEPTTFCLYHSYAEDAKKDGVSKIMDIIDTEYSPEQKVLDIDIDDFILRDMNDIIGDIIPEEDDFSDILD